jgi:hypothetical protein
MIEVLDRACVQILHHEQVRVVGPVFHLDLALGGFFHTIHEHASEVLALSC